MKINTKTKKSIFLSIMTLVLLASSAISYAAYDASTESNNCYGQECRRWHNDGITHSAYPYGTNFATFNNYNDATKAGRSYEEMQFMYIESQLAGSSNDFPLPTPWEDWSNYNFQSGTNHQINFNGNNPVRIGFWGYIHNNGTANQYPATGSQIKISGWNSSTPKNSYTPKYTLWADNTKPRSIWSNVGLTGNVPFTLTPVEAYIDREDGTWAFSAAQLQSITTSGIYIRSNSNNADGRIDSSHLHYVLIYVEFEAVPADIPGNCHSLTITDPSQTLLNVDENGFNDRNLAFTVDTDPNVVDGYRVTSSNGTVTFNNSGQSTVEINNTSTVMDGGPTSSTQNETVHVWALNENGTAINACHDSFTVHLEEEEELACEVLETTPPPSPVPLNEFTTIDIDTLLDTNGDDYLDNGAIPQIRYCYSNSGIQFLPDSGPLPGQGNGVIDSNGCAIVLATDPMNIIASEVGTMSIEVVGAPQCNDEFYTEATGGICQSLEFYNSYDEFDLSEDEYCVTLEVDEEIESTYNDSIRWTVERNGNAIYTSDTSNELCFDFDDHPSYNYEPGDHLTAQATGIVIDPSVDDCEDTLTSEERECTRFRLDRDTFERGQNNEVCVDSTDWPLDEGDDLEYSVDGGSTQTAELYDEGGDLCFILEEDELDDADDVEVWVPGWEDVCRDDLEVQVEPPEFEKNVRSNESGFAHRAIANFSDDYVEYSITYTHYANEPIDVEITDTIGEEGYIQGYIAGTETEINSSTPEGGRIYYVEGSMSVYVDGDRVDECDDDSEADDLCYERNIGDGNGVEIKNVPDREEVEVRYRGRIESEVNPENCSDPDHELNDTGVCGEIYPNRARFEDDYDFTGRDDAEVVIPCPFIIIRAGGDVFLENPFEYGVDTLSCAEIRNTDTPVITGNPPDDRDLASTGGDTSVMKQFDERLCNSDAEGSTDIAGISSLICELELTSEGLTQQAIVQSLSRNIQLFARYSRNLNDTPLVNGSLNLPYSSNNVYIKDDGDLTLGGTFKDKARTIVVIGHNVYINDNIKFEDPTDLSDPRKVPSLAVIVIGGHVVLDPRVEEAHLILFVQEGEDGGGQICEAPTTKASDPTKYCVDDPEIVKYNSDTRLTLYGSIYGDPAHLLKYRVKYGDLTQEQGAVTIRFDNRVYLNTPPLLNQLVDVTQKAF